MARWRLLIVLVAAALAGLPAAANDAARPDYLPEAADPEGPLYAHEPARFVVRVANDGAAVACAVTVRLAAGGASAATTYENHAAHTSVTRTLSLPGLPPGEHEVAVSVEAPGCNERTEANNALALRLRWVERPVVTAALAAAPARGAAPLDVAFTVEVAGARDWTLDFGDGAVARGEGAPPALVRHAYGAPGSYTASLRATNGSVEARAVAAVVVDAPAAARRIGLAVAPAEGPAPLEATLAVTGAADAESYVVDFGDGATASAMGGVASLAHRYANPGLYEPVVTARFADGEASARGMVRVLAGALAPPALRLALEPGAAPLSVVARIEADASVVSWRLLWGDGAIANGEGAPPATLAHSFALPGAYRAVLEARAANGAAASATATADVAGASLLATGAPFLTAASDSGEAPRRVVFRGGCACRDVLAWNLSFGDGHHAWGVGTPPEVPHLYRAGSFTARLVLETLRGPVEAAPVEVHVAGPTRPRLAVEPAPGLAHVAVAVPLDASAPWDVTLSDGRGARGEGNLVFEHPLPAGRHEARLRVGEALADVVAFDVPAPSLRLDAAKASGRAPFAATLRPAADAAILHWAIEWGDGAVESGAGPLPASLARTYGPGSHVARLTAVDHAGARLVAEAALRVDPSPPALDVASSPRLLLVVAGEDGTLTVDDAPATAYTDARLAHRADPLPGGTRYVPCAPGPRIVRLATPWGVAEREVDCLAEPAGESRRTVDFATPPGTRPVPGAAVAAALAALGLAARHRRGGALLLVAVLVAGAGDARFQVLNDDESYGERTREGDLVEITSGGQLEITTPDLRVFAGRSPIALPPDVLADGTWSVSGAPEQSAGCASGAPPKVRYRIDRYVNEIQLPACTPFAWSFRPEDRAYSSLVVGGRMGPSLLPVVTPVLPDAWWYHPWGPIDYESSPLGRSVASLTDYDADGRPTTGELADGTCPFSKRGGRDDALAACGRAAEAPLPAANLPSLLPASLRASLAWSGDAWGGVPSEARLRVEPPGRGALSYVRVDVPAGYALDLAATRAKNPGWDATTEGPHLHLTLGKAGRAELAREAAPVEFGLVLMAPREGGRHDVRVYAASDRDAHPGAATTLPLLSRGDTAPPRIAHDAPAWANASRDVLLAATDDGSGVAAIDHRVNGGPWIRSALAHLPVAHGDATLEWRVADRSGNVATGSATTRRDLDAPTLSLPPAGTHEAPLTVAPTSADATSGLSFSGVRLAGGPWGSSVRLETEGDHDVEAVARDRAGHETFATARYRLAFPGAGILTATTDPAAPRPGAPYSVVLRLENARGYALTAVALSLDGEAVAIGDVAPGAAAEARFARVSDAPGGAFRATARYATPWAAYAVERDVATTVIALRSVELRCLPVVAEPGATPALPCEVRNMGDVAGRIDVEAGAAAVTATLAAGEARAFDVPLPALAAGERVVRVRAGGDPGSASVEVAVAGVAPRAILLDGGARNAGTVPERAAGADLPPGAAREVSGAVRAATADDAAGATGHLPVPGRLLGRLGPALPSFRGAGLVATAIPVGTLVADASGPLPHALVLAGGAVAVTDAAGEARLARPATVRYGAHAS